MTAIDLNKELFDKCKKIVFDGDDLFDLDIIIDFTGIISYSYGFY